MHDRHATPRGTHAHTRLDTHKRRQGTQAGPITTFEQKVAAARPRLLRLAQLNDVPLDAVEDVVQATLLESWSHLPYLREPDRFDAWLDGICRNMCRLWRRASRSALLHQERFSIQDAARQGVDIADPLALDPAEEVSRLDWEVLLDRALGYLPSAAREAVELCYLSELPRREAALHLGVTAAALEERLRRARHQLKLVLNGALRADAEDFGLAVDPERAFGWRETRQWCMFCGRHRLRGLFEPWPDGRINLRLRCPDCSRGQTSDLIRSGGIIALDSLHSFRPALKRLMQVMQPYFAQAVVRGWQPCLQCKAAVPVRIIGPDEPCEALPRRWPGLSLVLACPSCGNVSYTCTGIVSLWDAAALDFMAHHPRWVNEPEQLIDYEGQPAMRIRLTDIASTARFTLFVHAQTWQVLAAFQA